MRYSPFADYPSNASFTALVWRTVYAVIVAAAFYIAGASPAFAAGDCQGVTLCDTLTGNCNSGLEAQAQCVANTVPVWGGGCLFERVGGAQSNETCFDQLYPLPSGLVIPASIGFSFNYQNAGETYGPGWGYISGEFTAGVSCPNGATPVSLGDGLYDCDPAGPSCDFPFVQIGESCWDGSANDILKSAGVCADNCPNPTTPHPINFGIANKYLQETDYEGTGRMPLVFIRTYNSVNGRWDHSYGRSLDFVGTPTSEVQLVRDDGAVYRFSVDSNGGWVTWADLQFTLTENSVTGGWTVTTPEDHVEAYDALGRLVSVINRAGQEVVLSYDANGYLDGVTDYTGRTLDVIYDASGVLTGIIDPDGYAVEYTHDISGRLVSVAYPDETPTISTDNPTRIYHYEDAASPNSLTGITDENGDRFATWQYDPAGRPDGSVFAGGAESYDIAYNSGATVSVTNPLNLDQAYTLSTILGVPKVTSIETVATADVPAMIETYTYDANGYRDQHTDRNGNVIDYDYDSRGLLISRTEAAGSTEARTTTTTWHPEFRVPTQIIKPGQTINMTYDTSGRMLTRTITDTQTQAVPYTTTGNTRTWTYTYNALGLIATMDGPRTDVADITAYSYDPAGDLQTITNPLGHNTTILSRNGRGQPTATEDANGLITELRYDPRGRLIARTAKSSQGDVVTTFTYDGVGQLTSVVLADGSTLSYEYDAAHRLIAIENGLGERIEYVLDDAGNRIAETIVDQQSNILKSQSQLFDELSRLREDLGANGQSMTYSYDDNDNLIASADALARSTGQSFDALDRLIMVTDPDLNDAGYRYDSRDNPQQVTDPRGIITTYVYDGLDNLIQESSPDAGTTVHVYDAAGNLVQSTDARGVVTSISYDVLNRRIDIAYPSETSENIGYSYDAGVNGIGRLSGIADGSGSTTYSYDDRGNLIEETRVIDATLYATSYQYDLADHLVQITYPSGRIIAYARDSLSRIQSVTTQAAAGAPVQSVVDGLQYLPFGGSSAWVYGNGLNASQSYDLDYRLTDISIGAALDRDYSFDLVNNITGITDQLQPAQSQAFGYDNLDRLNSATGDYGDLEYGYDAVGNRLSSNLLDGTNSRSETYNYDAFSNRLASVSRDDNGALSTRTDSYTPAGSLESEVRHDGATFTYSYNARNRLVEIADNATPIASYTHNALGQRVQKDTALEQLHFVYDRNGQLIAEHTADGEVVREYLYVNGVPMAMAAAESGSATVETLTLDSEDPSVQFSGDWPVSTSIPGWLGSNYRVHAANGPPPGAVIQDNAEATFVGNWQSSTAIGGFEGSDYQFLSPNELPPGSVSVDNTDGAGIGIWATSTSIGGFTGANYQHHVPGAGADAFTWTIDVPSTGDYEVFAKWTAAANRASAAEYTINHVDSLDQPASSTATVNQRSNGGSPQSLGTFRFAAGSTTLSLAQSASGYAIADEVSLVPVDGSANQATWSFTATAEGDYTVSARWTAHPNRASDARYVIDYVDAASGQAQSYTATVNQQINGGEYNTIATLNLQAGSAVLISLTDGANGYVIADAMQLLEVANNGPSEVTWPFDLTQSGTYEVYARWTGAPNRARNARYAISNGGTQQSVAVDQTLNGGEWQLLTTVNLDATQSVEVTLNDIADGYVIADAVELRRIGGGGGQELYYLHTDHLGTPRTATDATQTVVWSWQGTPFGESAADEDPDGDLKVVTVSLRFPGQYFDVETGRHYNYFRDYDPSVGRYTTSDPIGLVGGLGRYAYANQSPTLMIDRYGLDASLYSRDPQVADPSDYTGPALPRLEPPESWSRFPGPFGPICGPSGSAWATWIPDGAMRDACEQHDRCYATCGRTQEQCDLEFLKNSQGPGGPGYAAAVATFGRGPYEAAQREAGCDEQCSE